MLFTSQPKIDTSVAEIKDSRGLKKEEEEEEAT
jgi:hypothetical protein